MIRISRPCYDKRHRCPGWAGGGMLYAKVTRCDGGYIEHGQSRCNKCNVVILPRWTRWLDWRYWDSYRARQIIRIEGAWARSDLRSWLRDVSERLLWDDHMSIEFRDIVRAHRPPVGTEQFCSCGRFLDDDYGISYEQHLWNELGD